jgi:hypothetical protein
MRRELRRMGATSTFVVAVVAHLATLVGVEADATDLAPSLATVVALRVSVKGLVIVGLSHVNLLAQGVAVATSYQLAFAAERAESALCIRAGEAHSVQGFADIGHADYLIRVVKYGLVGSG